MDSDSDDGSLVFIPAALQSNPTTPTRLSMSEGSGPIKCAGDMSHFQPHPDQHHFAARSCGSNGGQPVGSAGLQAFPRPRDSVDGAGLAESDGNDTGSAVDSRLERRKQNQYKRHGSLTLAWQQRVSGSRESRTRLSSEIDDYANSGSPIPAPANSSWYRPNRSSGEALPASRDRQETMRRLDSQQSAAGQTQRQSRWRSGSLATVSPATTAASLAYGYGGGRTGTSLFAPVNNFHIGSSSASQLYQSGYRRNVGGHSNSSSTSISSYDTSSRGLGATRASDNGSSDYVPVRTSYGYGTIGNNGDGARRLATSSTGSYIVHSPGLSSVPVPAPLRHAQLLADSSFAAPPSSKLGSFAGGAEDASDSDSDRASVLMIACTTNRSDARINGRGASPTTCCEQNVAQRLSECSAHFTDASPRNEWLAASVEQLHLTDAGGSTDDSPRRSSAVLSARSSGGSDFYEALYADAEYNLVPLSLRGDGASPDANVSVSASGRGRTEGQLPPAMTREMSGSGGDNQASVAFGDNCRGGGSGNSRQLPSPSTAWPSDAARFDKAQSASASCASFVAASPSSVLAPDATRQEFAGASFSSSSCKRGSQHTFPATHHSALSSRQPSSVAFHGRSLSAFPTLDTASPSGPLSNGGSLSGQADSTSTQVLPGGPANTAVESASLAEKLAAGREAISKRSRHEQLVCNPPTNPLPRTPADMAVSSLSLSAATPPLCTNIGPLAQTPNSSHGDSSSKSAGSTANTTAVCTPATNRSGGRALELGDLTKVHDGLGADAAATGRLRGIAESPTQMIAHRHQNMSVDLSKRLQATADLASSDLAPDKPASGECGSLYAGGCVSGADGDQRLHGVYTMKGAQSGHVAAPSEDLTRHPTLVFDHSPILRASELIGSSPSDRDGSSTTPVTPSDIKCMTLPDTTGRDECRSSEEFAHEAGIAYSSDTAAEDELVHDANYESLAASNTTEASTVPPRPRIQANGAHSRASNREAAEASLCRNSLFPNVVKQQSRCMSVLLQQGPHGGIRRIGPLLITQERGGGAIRNLNPAFIDMMDVQPVDASTAAFLKRSNIRRRSFSMPPNGPGGDWLNSLCHIISGSGGTKRANDSTSAGPGMWWPLNDDNCSDEVTHEVHVSSQDSAESGGRSAHGQQPTLERMGSSSTIASVALKPPPVLGAPRKGSVSSQLRLMTRADSAQAINSGSNGSYLRSNASQSSLAGHVPSLTHTTSDASDMSTSSVGASRQQTSVFASNGLSMHTAGTQLADVTMRTESGVITRSIKCMSLRLLVNRLASPEGNVDSDLMTDFLNSYRFFAHPIDVMRLIIARYLNCFATGAPGDDTEDSEADDVESCVHDGDAKLLIINGWRDNANGDAAVSSGDRSALPSGSKGEAKQAPSRQLPPLARNDGAIIQLRVMNIVKYWIKFHPHDFRLHHRLTRLLLLFLSHIQKQPGRAEFVNAIRQKLSSGKLLAVEMPSFASTSIPPGTSLSTAVPSQASSLRNSGVRSSTLDHTRSALDLRSTTTQQHGPALGASALSRPEFALSELHSGEGAIQSSNGGHLHTSVSLLDMHGQPNTAGSATRQLASSGPANSQPPAAASSRVQHAKKGSASYFKALFHPRSSRGNTGNLNSIDAGGETDAFSALNAGSVRIARRDDGSSTGAGAEMAASGESDLRVPNGDMYASDFGSLVMEALTKSGIPTPQTPVGRTLLNYSIANRNPYRVNLVGIDPATFAEQLTLLEHELFSRISATEFSLKGRVGNLETILHTMQGVAADSRNSASTLGGGGLPGQAGSTNPVPSLTAMTSWFNQATYWAVLAVLSEPTCAARALVIKQLVHVAFHCLARRNYYGAFEIVIALDNSAVRRLHDTWALVPVLMKDIVAKILQVLQSRMNFRTYRESVKAAMVGVSGPDEEVFDAVSDQIKSIRAKDMVSASQANIVTSNGLSSATSTGHSAASAGFGNLVHGALFGNGASSDEGKNHMRKKSIVGVNVASAKDAGQLTEQDCACITYAIRIRAASFMYFDPSTSNGPSGSASGLGYGHSSVPASSSSKGGRGSGGHLSSSNSKSSGSLASSGTGPVGSSGGPEASEARGRRARSTSNSSNGAAGGRTTPTFRNGRMITNGAPLPLVPFVAVHMTDLLHADEANSTYSEEHQKMRSRNPTGPETDAGGANGLIDDDEKVPHANKRQLRCDSAAISSVNQAQPLLNMQKFRLITSMFRELHLAQRTKYPYAADTMLQQQIHSAVRNIRAQTNDIYAVVQDVAATDPLAARPQTSHVAPFTRSRNDSSASRLTAATPDGDGGDHGAFGYPLYQIAALQKSHSGTSLLDASMDWDCTDVKDNQELEQRLYMLSKWIEPQAAATHR